MRRRTWLGVVAVAALPFTLAASCDRKGLGDAPVGPREEKPRRVVVMPDRFPNLAVVCDGSTAIYVNTKAAGNMLAIPDSTRCTAADR